MNTLPEDKAVAELLKCCGSRRWAQRIVQNRPFENLEVLCRTANQVWWECDRQDWLEAFRSHPKIGDQKAKANVSGQSQAWSSQEQSAVQQATKKTLAELAQLNREYQERFGFIFIVCASGRSADEMLSMLKFRLGNDNEKELQIAAGEQAKITELRLKKLVA